MLPELIHWVAAWQQHNVTWEAHRLSRLLLQRCVEQDVKLLDYRIQSINGGPDALAEVFVKVESEGTEASGRGVAFDVLESSAKAYLNAINRLIAIQQHRTKQEVM